MKPFWIWRSHAAATRQIGVRRITPFTQSIGLRWRGGGWLWQFPLAVEIDEADGIHRRLPISDPTRTVVWFLYAPAMVLLFVTALNLWRKQRVTQDWRAKQDRRARQIRKG